MGVSVRCIEYSSRRLADHLILCPTKYALCAWTPRRYQTLRVQHHDREVIRALNDEPQPPFDLLITDARIVDGTGGPSTSGAVAVRGGRIAAVGNVAGPAARTIDAGGKVVAPGFIDPHSHSDLPLLVDGNAESKIRQGVTTEVIGESGSVAPRLSDPARGAGGAAVAADWTDFSGYFAAVERSASTRCARS